MNWQYLNLTKPESCPPEGALVVVRLGSFSSPGADYHLGRFQRDGKDPQSRKLWFYRAGGGISDPTKWRKYHTDVRYAVIDTPEGRCEA